MWNLDENDSSWMLVQKLVNDSCRDVKGGYLVYKLNMEVKANKI